MSLTTHHIISHSTGFSNSRTCTGAELFQIWFHPRDFLCMFISNGLTSPKWSPAGPTPRLKLSRVQVHRVTLFSICLKMGLCADTGYVQSVSFSVIYFTSILLKSVVIFFGTLSLVMVSYRGSPDEICLWKTSTWLFAQIFHEVWRHGENL